VVVEPLANPSRMRHIVLLRSLAVKRALRIQSADPQQFRFYRHEGDHDPLHIPDQAFDRGGPDLRLHVIAPPSVVNAQDHDTSGTMHVVKSPTCGCCEAWVALARDVDFTVETTYRANVTTTKQQAGVPQSLWSCNTAMIDGYFIEGHVPSMPSGGCCGTGPRSRDCPRWALGTTHRRVLT
jgi:hypothetical protein